MAGEDLPKAMARLAGIVETALDNLLPEPEGAEARLAEAMRYATLGGGKRLRAFLVMETAGAVRRVGDLRCSRGRRGGDDTRLLAGA